MKINAFPQMNKAGNRPINNSAQKSLENQRKFTFTAAIFEKIKAARSQKTALKKMSNYSVANVKKFMLYPTENYSFFVRAC